MNSNVNDFNLGIKLGIIKDIVKIRNGFKIDFEIILNKTNKVKVLSLIVNNDYKMEILGDIKSVNNEVLNLIKLSVMTIKSLDIKNLSIFSKEANLTSLDIRLFDREVNLNIDWINVIELNPIDIPYSNGMQMGNYLDPKTLLYLCNQNANSNNAAELALVYTNINMLLSSVIMNRLLHYNLLLQNLYFLEAQEGKSIFNPINRNILIEYNNRNIKIDISGKLSKNFSLNLNIIAFIDNKKFLLTDTNSNFSMDTYLKLLEYIHGEDLTYVNIGTKTEPLKVIKFVFDIITADKKSIRDNLITFNPIKSMYLNGYGYDFNIISMEINEVFTPLELMDRVEEYIKSLF